MSISNEGEIFRKLRKFIANRPALKKLLQTKETEHQKETQSIKIKLKKKGNGKHIDK